MPSKLEEPIIDDVSLIDNIVTERAGGRNKQFFEDYKNSWIERYNEYINNNGNPENIDNSHMIPNKSKFINLYDTKPGIIKTAIIDLVRYQGLTYCPFCSEAGVPVTLDHFLPKSDYPEYSLLSKNLVPMCDACQGADAKGTKVFNDDDKRLFLHPYFDDIEDIEILTLEILPPYDKDTKYKLYINESLDNELRELSIRHIDELNIQKRFKIYFISQYMRLKKLAVSMLKRGISPDEIKNKIEDFYEERKITGINYWDTVFYKSVLNNNNLLNYLKTINIS